MNIKCSKVVKHFIKFQKIARFQKQLTCKNVLLNYIPKITVELSLHLYGFAKMRVQKDLKSIIKKNGSIGLTITEKICTKCLKTVK